MKIIIDAMSGDNAPEAIVRGTALASREFDAEFVLVGDESVIRQILSVNDTDMSKIRIVPSASCITMEDEPTSVVRAKKDSSMAVALKMLREDGDACVSAGNTGALHVGGSLLVRAVKGVERAAIATILPFTKPMLLMDCGANVNVTPDYYVNWAIMGQIYMKNVMGVENPTVGLLNNGTEEHKGTAVEVEAFKKMTADGRINFIGNVEGKELMSSPCDVIITDGFTGNITLKTVEGLSKFLLKQLKGVFTANFMTKISYLMIKDRLSQMKDSFDSSAYGGAPLLGLSRPVIKAHGSSDDIAIKNAIGQAISFAETGVVDQIREVLTSENTVERA